MNQALLLTALLLLAPQARAQDEEGEPLPPTISLAELAASSDLVAVARVLDTDYEYRRGFPVGGTAFLQVLIPYKVGRPLEDIIEVYDEGLKDNECYFENPSVLEEGRRYLVFLKFSKDVEAQYNGHERGCALQVFVNEHNRYALKYPVTGIDLSDRLEEHATAQQYADRYAVVEDEELSPDERNDLLERGLLIEQDLRYKYTHGIELATVRELMGPEALTLDRTLK